MGWARPRSGRFQQPPLPRERLPMVQSGERVPDHAALVGNGWLAEFTLKRLTDGLREPGPAPDIQSVGVRIARERRPPEFVCERHVVGAGDFLKFGRRQNLRRDAGDLYPA